MFKGDLVQLKSGGPIMTVTEGSFDVKCQWFDTKNQLQTAVFRYDILVKVKN